MEGDEVTDRVIECPCGVVLTAQDTKQVVGKAQEHALEVHQMDLSDEQARSMARPA
jgi:predicted small metal-binding protein